MPRLDTFLRDTGLVRRRSDARQACTAGHVRVDGQAARAARTIREGEVLSIEVGSRYLEIEILALPERPVARADRERYYRVLRQERRDPNADLEF